MLLRLSVSNYGDWRSLVARLFRVQEAVSSNLASPTITDPKTLVVASGKKTVGRCRLFLFGKNVYKVWRDNANRL